MQIPKTIRREKQTSFLSLLREDIFVIAIWVLSLVPAFLISVFKRDPFYASVITILIQFLASFGSITLFGVISQLICYRYIASSNVHDRVMDGLFYGFHAGMIIWVLYAFFRMLVERKYIVGETNSLIGFFGTTCVVSCVVGILCGFVLGGLEERRRSKGL